MDSSKDKARNELTPEQKAKVRPATEKDAKVSSFRWKSWRRGSPPG